MNDVVKQIIKYLKTQPENSVDWTDGPYQRFAAEWQDWSFQNAGSSQLFCGYWYEQNGDMVPDPNIHIHLLHDTIKSVTLSTAFGSQDATSDDFPEAFVDLIWSRHFKKRCTSASNPT
jgi:hypothetical protein